MADREEILDGLVDYSEDGVDLTLIRWALSMTPEERLLDLQGCINSLDEMLCASAG